MVRKEGVEPSRVSPPDPKSGASASSATFARTDISGSMLPSAPKNARFVRGTLRLADRRRRPSVRLAARQQSGHDSLSHDRPIAANRDARGERLGHLSRMRRAGVRRLRVVRRRSQDGLRLPGVPSTGLADRRLAVSQSSIRNPQFTMWRPARPTTRRRARSREAPLRPHRAAVRVPRAARMRSRCCRKDSPRRC